MQISLKWIDELIDIRTICLKELIRKLTLGGFEVEETIEINIGTQTQITLDVSATANRPDSLAIHGISSEIGALLNQPLRNIKYLPKNLIWPKRFDGVVHALPKNSECQAFMALTIENIQNSTSPKWLQQKLIYSGINPENTLSDFQTYVQLETGYPFELYDLEKVASNANIQNSTLRLANDGKVQKIFFNNKAIGTAGINPSDHFKCSSETTKILLEGSIFNASTIRQRSRLIGSRTDRSMRYEKSINDADLTGACYRLISLLRIKNPTLQCKFHTNSKVKRSKRLIIQLRYSAVKEILGPIKNKVYNEYIVPQQITEYLKRLNFEQIYDNGTKTWNVTVPRIRNSDILEEIDLIEEIGRLHGFDNFVTQLPKIKRLGVQDASYRIRKKLTTIFLGIGLTEFVHYSLTNPQRQNIDAVELINPLLLEYSNLRVSLLPNLIKTLSSNMDQGNSTIEGFEYGHVFVKTTSTSIYEREVIAGVIGGIELKSTWATDAKSMNWFEAKGRLEQIWQKLNLKISWECIESNQCMTVLHPYCASQLFLANTDSKVGIFGQINPILAKQLNLPLLTYLFELDFDIIKKSILKTTMIMAKQYSLYPKITKDLSIIVSNDIVFEEIRQIIYLNGSQVLTEINLVDEYNGSTIPDFHTSLCLQLVFQSDKQTLKNKQVDKILANIKSILVERFNIVFR